MPELPEVETIVRQLKPLVTGRKLVSLVILDPKLDIENKPVLKGRKVIEVRRLGKQVGIHLSSLSREKGSLWLLFHLRMTGRLIWNTCRTAQKKKSLRAKLVFDRGCISFYDTRRFGVIDFFHTFAEALPRGIDPFSPGFTRNRLAGMLDGSSQAIKPWLLRQDRLTGLGNIYASETLFDSCIDPRRPSGSLNVLEVRRLHTSVKKILRRAIENCGTTFDSFQDTRGKTGSFQNFLSVYGRDGEPCPKCGGQIVRLVQQGRSTFFCPRDQK